MRCGLGNFRKLARMMLADVGQLVNTGRLIWSGSPTYLPSVGGAGVCLAYGRHVPRSGVYPISWYSGLGGRI